MINLLPPDVKSNYQYARRNVVLRRWMITVIIAFVGLGIITTFGSLTIHESTVSYDKQVATTQQLFKQEKFDDVQKQVQSISSDFKLVIKVLGQEVLFSQLIKQLATIIPKNAVLTGLNINQAQSGLDITASATDYSTATQVQVNLADPANKIFSGADLLSVSCSGNAADTNYPCTVNVRALFSPSNPYMLVNTKAKP